MTKYTLPALAYGFGDLAPVLSAEQVQIHYEKHHQAYVTAANDIVDKLDTARKDNVEIDQKSLLKSLSFNIGGHLLHSLFWANLRPVQADNAPSGELAKKIIEDFFGWERFKQEFVQTAMTVEGSGWAILAFDKNTNRLLINQIEKHNANLFPTLEILLALDMFEHTYYIDYKNNKEEFLKQVWQIINWNEIEKRFANIK